MRRRSMVVLAVLSGLFSVVTAVAVNVATGGTLPEPVAWPVVGVLAVAAIGLAVWQQRVPSEPARVVNELPARTGLTGREGDLQHLRRLIRSGHHVLALVGPPGVGKSALAVQVAHEYSARYPEAHLFAVLRGAAPDPVRPESVLERFLGTLGAPENDRGGTVDELAARWRARLAGRRLIVVLDDARDAAQVRPLLPGDPRCLVLITSRRMLHDLPGAAQHTLGALTDDDARRLLGEAAARDPAGTDALVGHCGGLPLALGIAAARLRARPAWTPGDLAARLADERHRLSELRLGDLAVRASFATSYADQPAPEQEVFRRAGSHPGRTFGTGAAAALAGTDERTVAAALERLVDAHLVETPAPGLFRLHDLLRLFATENLTAAEHRECLSRLLAWLTGHADPRERDNAIAAAHQGLALGLHEQVWDLVLATLPTLRRVSDHADRLTLWTAAAEAAKALGDDSRRARALHWVSWGYGMAGLAGPALAAAEEAVALAGPGTLAAALFSQGRALRVVRRYAEAEAALRRALDLYEQAGAADDADEVRITLGLVCNVSGRPGEAIEWVRGVRRPWALSTLSVAYKLSGRPAEAAALNDRVIATARQDNDAYLLAYAVRERGLLALDAHRLADARRDLCDALTMLESFPDQMGVCGVHANLGALAVAEGHPAEALLEYATAGEAYERLGHRAAAGESHLRRAEILDDLGRPTEAAQERARARELL